MINTERNSTQNMTYEEKKSLYESLMKDVAKILKRKLNESDISIKSKYLSNVEFLYHATPACYVNSIKKCGLGDKMPKTRLWDYNGTPYDNITQGCFLAADEYVAESYVENSETFEELADAYEERYGKELEIVVFAVRVDDLNEDLISLDSNQDVGEDDEPTFFYAGVIPYSKLTRVKMY